jgi:hypothetical protein
MKASRITAVGLVAATAVWILSGYLLPHESAESKAALRVGETKAEKRFRVAVIDTNVVSHSRKLLLSGRTEADLRGAELTGAWLNEVSEIPKNVVTFAAGRVGRYPAVKDGGPTWSGMIADSNAWDQDHWLHALYTEPPKGWKFFRQAGAVLKLTGQWEPNPDAENLKHLPPEYYTRMLAGQSEDWIRVYLGNEFGFSIDGKVVYPEWSDSMHVAPQPLPAIPDLPLHIGLDFGLTPAAIIGQRTSRGQWRIIDELIAEDMGLVRFSEILAQLLAERYAGFKDVHAWGDPAGNARSQTDEKSCLEVVREYAAIPCQPAPTNEFSIRREAVASSLTRLIDGVPAFLLSPRCKALRKGFAGGYHYKRLKVSGDDRYHDKPDKNASSHPHDALQYLLSGGGEGAALLRPRGKPMAKLRYPENWAFGNQQNLTRGF